MKKERSEKDTKVLEERLNAAARRWKSENNTDSDRYCVWELSMKLLNYSKTGGMADIEAISECCIITKTPSKITVNRPPTPKMFHIIGLEIMKIGYIKFIRKIKDVIYLKYIKH